MSRMIKSQNPTLKSNVPKDDKQQAFAKARQMKEKPQLKLLKTGYLSDILN